MKNKTDKKLLADGDDGTFKGLPMNRKDLLVKSEDAYCKCSKPDLTMVEFDEHRTVLCSKCKRPGKPGTMVRIVLVDSKTEKELDVHGRLKCICPACGGEHNQDTNYDNK